MSSDIFFSQDSTRGECGAEISLRIGRVAEEDGVDEGGGQVADQRGGFRDQREGGRGDGLLVAAVDVAAGNKKGGTDMVVVTGGEGLQTTEVEVKSWEVTVLVGGYVFRDGWRLSANMHSGEAGIHVIKVVGLPGHCMGPFTC